MADPTRRPVLLPGLLVAGARVIPQAMPGLWWVVGAALAARIAAKLVVGWILCAGFASARRAGATLGLGLLSTGALAIAIGLSFALRFPGPVGDTVLVIVSVVTVFGEFVVPGRMRASLLRAGEIAQVKATETAAPDKGASESPEAQEAGRCTTAPRPQISARRQ